MFGLLSGGSAARHAAVLAVACVAIGSPVAWAGKPNKKKQDADPDPPPAATPPPPAAAEERTKGPALPPNVNLASLRLAAMQTLYELDASPEQLKAVKGAAAGLADPAERASAKGPPKLVAAMKQLQEALLSESDDKQIADARNAMADAMAEVDPPLDDAVHPSPAARTKAAAVCQTFSAGQLAAYLASHADQVVGPGDRLVSSLSDLKDEPPADADAEVKQVSTEVGLLVAGADADKAAAAAAKAAEWLQAHRATGAPDSADARAKLEASARDAVGDPPPAEVLGHWFENEVAELLANPQLPKAVAPLLTARQKEQH
jgi:hypothetical protein